MLQIVASLRTTLEASFMIVIFLLYRPLVMTTYIRLEWNSTFFAFSLIIEGTTEKVLQVIMPLKTIYKQIFGFISQKMYF